MPSLLKSTQDSLFRPLLVEDADRNGLFSTQGPRRINWRDVFARLQTERFSSLGLEFVLYEARDYKRRHSNLSKERWLSIPEISELGLRYYQELHRRPLLHFVVSRVTGPKDVWRLHKAFDPGVWNLRVSGEDSIKIKDFKSRMAQAGFVVPYIREAYDHQRPYTEEDQTLLTFKRGYHD